MIPRHLRDCGESRRQNVNVRYKEGGSELRLDLKKECESHLVKKMGKDRANLQSKGKTEQWASRRGPRRAF